jgi:hypothetical protein
MDNTEHNWPVMNLPMSYTFREIMDKQINEQTVFVGHFSVRVSGRVDLTRCCECCVENEIFTKARSFTCSKRGTLIAVFLTPLAYWQ